MPGLLRGMARTAVIAGTATAVSNNVSRRQARRWSNEEQPAQEAPQVAPAVDVTSELQKLADLKDKGILTEEEFAAQKAKLLA